MTSRWRATRRVVVVALWLCAHAASGWSAQLTPRVAGWEQFFKIDWQTGVRGGKPVVDGHVYNDWGFDAKDVRLLVEGLEADGRVTWQKVEWQGSNAAPGARVPFEIAVPASAPAYRISVFSFDWVQAGGATDR